MSDHDLIVEIENSFRYMRFIDCTIAIPTTKSYTPVRNRNGGYDLDLRVSAVGDVIDYVSDDFNVWAAKVQYLVRLTDCTYSNETGRLNWDSETGSCEIIHNAFSPNVITFSDDQCGQNNADLPNYRYTGGIELADDITLGHFLSERMFYSSRLSERSEMISKVVAGIKIDSCFAKRYQNNPLTA